MGIVLSQVTVLLIIVSQPDFSLSNLTRMKENKQLQTCKTLKSPRQFEIYQDNFSIKVTTLNPKPPLVQKPQVVIIQDVVRIPNVAHCRFCNQNTDTYVTYRNGFLVWFMFFFLLLFTIIFCWLAFFFSPWKDSEYRCTKCHQVKYVKKGKCC